MKNDSLDGLRGLAAFSVLLAHLAFSFFPYLSIFLTKGAVIPQAYGWESYAVLPIFQVFYNGTFAVAIFFALSGYVLTKKFFETGSRQPLMSGAIKRYPRLIIPTAASVLIAWVMLSSGLMNTFRVPELGGAGWPYDDYNHVVSFKRAIWDALVGAPFLGSNSLNAPLWTISIELVGSLVLFASYVFAGPRRILFAFACFMIAIICFMTTILKSSPVSIVIVHFIAIFSGSLIHKISPMLRDSPKACLLLIAAGLVFGGMDYSGYYVWVPMMGGHERVVMNTLGGILLVAGVIGHAGASKALATRIPKYLGKMSFSIYLIHWPIICSFSFGASYYLQFSRGFSQQSAAFTTIAATIVLVYGLAYFFEKFVERPATDFANHFSAKLLARSPKLATAY